MTIQDVLFSLQGVRRESRQWKARCPAHEDREPSLTIREGHDGRILMYCHAGCSYSSIAAAIGASPKDLAGDGRRWEPPPRPEPCPVMPGLGEYVESFEKALPGSPGERYLAERSIPLPLAQLFRVGWAADGEWPHQFDQSGRFCRQWINGRLVFPHTTPGGTIVNLYGRAVGEAPKTCRHDHLRGNRGAFNAEAIATAREEGSRLYVTEGAFDALAVMAAGLGRATAIFGAKGWRSEWFHGVQSLVLALDNDATGRNAAKDLATEAKHFCGVVSSLPASLYGDAKDVNESLIAGTLAA